MSDEAAVQLSPALRWIVILLILMSILMVSLDMTIANVALPHMQASLGASPESISWVLTSYILGTAIFTPLTGWLGGRIGRKQLFVASLLGFTLASLMCGLSSTLAMEVAARFVQGMSAAIVAPSSQALMIDINPKKEQMRAVTIWGIGAMVGPIMGPIIGGYLTDAINWRWVFFINLPIGVVAIIGLWFMLPQVPSPVRKFDKTGFMLLAVALVAFQLMLDRGTLLGWFESPEIIVEAGLALSCFWMLVVHLLRSPTPIIPLQIFRDRNLVASIIFMFFVGGVATAGSALVPQMTQSLLNYPVIDAGYLMVPRSIAMIAGMILSARLIRFVDIRLIIGMGVVLNAISMWMTTTFDLQMGSDPLIYSGFVLGLGLGMSINPINFLFGSTLPSVYRPDAAALYSLSRNIGSSIILSIATAMIARNVQVNHAELGGRFTSQTMPLLQPGFLEQMGIQGRTAAAMLDVEINRQAMMIAYLNDYWMLTICIVAVIPVVLIIRPIKLGKDAPAPIPDAH